MGVLKMTIDRMSSPYQLGDENYYADFELKDNPYQVGSNEHIEWVRGYLDALNAQN
tara:strand:+ start:244 stop:411 length:168 start_codon:yes stop_codon:yes gene_type:complete